MTNISQTPSKQTIARYMWENAGLMSFIKEDGVKVIAENMSQVVLKYIKVFGMEPTEVTKLDSGLYLIKG